MLRDTGQISPSNDSSDKLANPGSTK
jgi:hypothetical protein